MIFSRPPNVLMFDNFPEPCNKASTAVSRFTFNMKVLSENHAGYSEVDYVDDPND